MKNNLLPAFRLTLVLLVLCAGLYPALIWAAAQLAPNGGRGETVRQNGRVVGYANVGQKFDRPEYFHGRPSAVDYNATGSAGSNKGPSNPEYLAAVRARLDTFLRQNPGVRKEQVPAELLTASGSGLDPHLSPRGVAVQVARIAKARNLAVADVQSLVRQHTETSFLAPARVNVLQLNLALDQVTVRR
ncbi:potassium-transporting ATPase subunit KdpC [Hymenobacter sp. BT664]|uniref:Potassium-transporting ATPase KdpC subunit n=1 Tax=Hymenobacter montanus TaxID=2771359 RepID=A0A927BGE9_9BACT|nr:potassium-transporting ATPase subunit KdpC [Hymenobacter montanus]MBD2769438.1 potassium-transporting ATPase subunit KdpC [Hymenobacter montanus]